MIIKATLRKASLGKTKRNLDILIEKVERQGKREALLKAGRPMVRNVKAKVGRDKGHLKKSIKQRIRTYKKDQLIILYIGPDRRYKTQDEEGNEIRPIYYAVPDEFGTKNRAANGGFRQGFDMSKSLSLEIYKREIKASIKRAGRRLERNFKV